MVLTSMFAKIRKLGTSWHALCSATSLWLRVWPRIQVFSL